MPDDALVLRGGPCPSSPTVEHAMVAVVLTWRGRVGVFKRSRETPRDPGLWDCMTRPFESATSVAELALHAVHDDAGLPLACLSGLDVMGVAGIDAASGQPVAVHVVRAWTSQRRLVLGPAHTAFRWVAPGRLRRFDGRTAWLDKAVGLMDLP